ncbi:hypothetical protein K450DRAFT_261130 [Umbelopsis ramanniana AG]|uniref:DUF1692-domain-containing protein n=1 Tax=Umbelopsis ramanniana AG TaxID=1314678 RepID=A0AAD5E172_UMBRA|nr:uncharacterized protein K450DRAFT_261130 [Umbelopsis ramanniana AG]KAI8575601.1 hypothetical protein K450DRAFT_261130 [Umbelopsis ramanniana AG]
MSLRKLSEKVSQLDAFPKVEEDNKHRSGQGGLLTLVLAVVLTLLTFSEIADYRHLNTSFEFLVDHQVARKVQINLDMVIAMPCPGERLHLTNNFKNIPAQFEVANARLYGQAQDPTHIHQIIKAAKGQKVDDAVARDMGACRVLGSFEANKVAANLHITAQGHGYQTGAHTDHQVLNFTHRINEFSFGKLYPNLINPLDDSIETTDSHFHSFQYFMSVVPTTYIDNSHNVLETYQYAVTDSSKSFTEMEALYNVPGIFFKYDFEPISVRITEKRQSFSHFLVRLSGIIGGAVVCVGFAYRVIRFVLTGGKENPDMYAGVHNLMKSV